MKRDAGMIFGILRGLYDSILVHLTKKGKEETFSYLYSETVVGKGSDEPFPYSDYKTVLPKQTAYNQL
jgi:hypothetical protein